MDEELYFEGKFDTEAMLNMLEKKAVSYTHLDVYKRQVAEKYGGELLLKDQGEHFEAVLLLNGVAKLEGDCNLLQQTCNLLQID